jgi:hypothetical protein
MKPLCFGLTLVLLGVAARPAAHGIGSTPTWNREISPLVYDKCASCHRPGGTAFSLMTYSDAQPTGNEIKDAVLSRRMPPWGAVRGFGRFRNDQSLMQEQIELFSRSVDGGIRRETTRCSSRKYPPSPRRLQHRPSAVWPSAVSRRSASEYSSTD